MSDLCELCRGISLRREHQNSSLRSIRERTASCNGCAVLLQALSPYVSDESEKFEISTFSTPANQPYVIRFNESTGFSILQLDQDDVYITITAVQGTQHGPKNLEQMRMFLTKTLR